MNFYERLLLMYRLFEIQSNNDKNNDTDIDFLNCKKYQRSERIYY